MVRNYYSLRLHCYSYVLFFTPPSITMSSGPETPPNPPSAPTQDPHYTIPTRPTPPPTAHHRPRGHLSTWTLTGSCYTESLIDGSLVSPMESPLSTTFLSPCIPHVDRLSTLTSTGQPLTQAPIIYPVLLQLVRIPPS